MYKIDEKTAIDTLNYICGSNSQTHNALFSAQLITKFQRLEKIEEKIDKDSSEKKSDPKEKK